MIKMLLRNVTLTELAGLYEKHKDRSPAPYLLDKAAVTRARSLAKKNGIWSDLTENLDGLCEIPVLKRSDFRNYQRVGDRTLPQARAGQRRRELSRASMALWLGHPNANVDYLQDLLWAYCDDWTWVMAAHEGRSIDLGSAALGASMAEIVHVLGGHLEDEVKDRVSVAIKKHIFDPFWDYGHLNGWETVRMNWNHVCNGEIIRAALYQLDDARVLARMTHGAIQNLTYALDGFTDDGGCEEGPGYWGYGFGHYLSVAYALFQKTNGELNIMADDTGKIERICRYPLAAHISGALRSTFADSSHGYTGALAAMTVNHFFDVPDLYALCQTHKDRTLTVGGMHELAMYSGFKVSQKPDANDYVLPDMGQVKLRGKAGKQQMTLMCLAGNNGVPHNHNDIGSFIVHKYGKLLLTDPGGPVYSRKTFGPKRYDILFCNSLGHSVPVINGKLQQPGSRYFGTLTVENLNGKGTKIAEVNMTKAYPAGTVKSLIRRFLFDSDKNCLTLEDHYTFAKAPRALIEGFVTLESVSVKGNKVQIGSKSSGLTLQAVGCDGKFEAVKLVEESKEGRSDQVVTRIAFVPSKLAKEMILKFSIA
ncbi:MAG: heparinase II/III family protein [bacterium]|nr:heparinase II/III family protein [bacterium]